MLPHIWVKSNAPLCIKSFISFMPDERLWLTVNILVQSGNLVNVWPLGKIVFKAKVNYQLIETGDAKACSDQNGSIYDLSLQETCCAPSLYLENTGLWNQWNIFWWISVLQKAIVNTAMVYKHMLNLIISFNRESLNEVLWLFITHCFECIF